MASVICPNCGNKCRARLDDCPKCGSPLHDPDSVNYDYQIVKVRVWGVPSQENLLIKLEPYISEGWEILYSWCLDSGDISATYKASLRRPKELAKEEQDASKD